ncbi:hypothetical protein Tco_1273841 [Tanacetum coccineum]
MQTGQWEESPEIGQRARGVLKIQAAGDSLEEIPHPFKEAQGPGPLEIQRWECLNRAGQALGILPALEVALPVETILDTETTSATLKSRTMVSTPPKGLGPSTEDPF